MKFAHPWPPIVPIDEKRYNIELKDGTVVFDVEYWAFGGGFEPVNSSPRNKYVQFPLDEVISFSVIKPKI